MSVELEGTSGRARRLGDDRGQVVIVFYESRDQLTDNAALKSELERRAKQGDRSLPPDVAVRPIANLGGSVPTAMRPFARAAVRAVARRLGLEILLDWEGAMRDAGLGLDGDTSHVLVLDATGSVAFHGRGRLDDAQRAEFFVALGRAAILRAATLSPEVCRQTSRR